METVTPHKDTKIFSDLDEINWDDLRPICKICDAANNGKLARLTRLPYTKGDQEAKYICGWTNCSCYGMAIWFLCESHAHDPHRTCQFCGTQGAYKILDII